MRVDNELTFQKIHPLHPEVAEVIALSIGFPSLEKVKEVLKEYTHANRTLMGSFFQQRLVAIIGIELVGTMGIIKHISVLRNYRSQGLGKQLIYHVFNTFSIICLFAETDDDAVDFYQKLGFRCQPFESPHGKRYECLLSVQPQSAKTDSL
jgi:ribosomal protein S18 acetylase RimI-like enzyme